MGRATDVEGSPAKRTLLVNFVYCRPVGHVVEALTITKRFAEANRDLEIHLLLNSRSAVEITEACPWIKQAYAVDLDDVLENGGEAAIFKAVPALWDYVAVDNRAIIDYEQHGYDAEPELVEFHRQAERYFRASRWQGVIWDRNFPPELGYNKGAQIHLNIPDAAKAFAAGYTHAGPLFCLLLGGSAENSLYPSLDAWMLILDKLYDAFPDCKCVVTGVSGPKDGRTFTRTVAHVPALLERYGDRMAKAFDVGLWNQLALFEKSDILIAPHSGFAFLAACVGTPWLEICGTLFTQYLHNQVPFYSVKPRCDHFPCYQDETWHYDDYQKPMLDACHQAVACNQSILCMNRAGIALRSDEIVQSARLLLDDKFTFERAMASHLERFPWLA